MKKFIIKGFTMDDERLKGNGGDAYWSELPDRIRDIRSSEKVMYRQVLDLYATAVYYDPRSEISVEFFKIVQNKLHFAAHGNTATEVIFMRADADAPMMGLISFKGDRPTLRDAQITKNCVYSCVYSVVYIVMSSPDDYILQYLGSCIFISNIHGDVSRFQNRHAGLMPSINDVVSCSQSFSPQ